MAISQIDARLRNYNQTDRLSSLPDALLITILSLLPTHIAACTSVLSRRFRFLWEASPFLELVNRYKSYPKDDMFVPMATRAILNRDPSHPIFSLRMEILGWVRYNNVFVSSLLTKVCSFNLRHLNIECWEFEFLSPVLPAILSIKSLESLSMSTIKPLPGPFHEENYVLPSAVGLTRLRSLFLEIYDVNFIEFNLFLSKLVYLEDLHLGVSVINEFALSSQTIRKLEFIIFEKEYRSLDVLRLSLPLLEMFLLENRRTTLRLPCLQGGVPLLKKANLNLGSISKEGRSVVGSILNFLSHVEELSLRVKELKQERYPFPNLWDESEDLPNFPNLKHLDMSMCFHEDNFKGIVSMLHHCPTLESVRLVHELPKFTGWVAAASARKRKDWKSKLPRNADRNYRYAYFRNLHLEENRKYVLRTLIKKCTSNKRHECN